MSIPRTWLPIFALLILALGTALYFALSIDVGKTVTTANQPGARASAQIVSSSSEATPRLQPVLLPQPQQSSTTDGVATFMYNAQGQLQLIRYSDGSVYLYRYDSHGDKISETNRIGRTWTYVYDQQQRPISILDPDGRFTHPGQPSNAQ
jgi:YD repeat-containing protein